MNHKDNMISQVVNLFEDLEDFVVNVFFTKKLETHDWLKESLLQNMKKNQNEV